MKNRMVNAFRKIYSFAAKRLAKRYLRKDRSYTYGNLKLIVYKDVFHPGLFRSTRFFAEWLGMQDIGNQRVLEVGSGSGLISLVAAKKGAIVTAVDINPKAVENTKHNAAINQADIRVLQSDLLGSVNESAFDLVLINPPYYPRQPRNDYEKAWYCGEDFEYFHRLFPQLVQHGLAQRCYMILSDTCDLVKIASIAKAQGLQLAEVVRKKISGEQLIIYKTMLLPEINGEG